MLCRKLPPDFDEKFAPFLGQVVRLQKMNDHILSKVRNPEETLHTSICCQIIVVAAIQQNL
jgi:hypothetical protein